ncbi:hypothetical protein BaRGS_00004583, partial [Batillaria attramentaria]
PPLTSRACVRNRNHITTDNRKSENFITNTASELPNRLVYPTCPAAFTEAGKRTAQEQFDTLARPRNFSMKFYALTPSCRLKQGPGMGLSRFEGHCGFIELLSPRSGRGHKSDLSVRMYTAVS